MKRLFLLLLLLAGLVPVQAQTSPLRLRPAAPSDTVVAEPVIDLTLRLSRRPEAVQALAEYQRLKAAGLLPASKTAETFRIGDQRQFKVLNYEKSGGTDLSFDTFTFTLKAEGERFLLWVENGELAAAHVRPADIEAMAAALGARTPAGSFNSNAGIIENNEVIFGNPPDYDHDGRTDVLLVDVKDGWQIGQGYVAGFVWSADLQSDTRYGNARDIVYLDTYPSIYYADGTYQPVDRAASTLAHEYQHLIRFNHDADEETFVDEGLSEWASRMNGYNDRGVSYLDFPSERNRSLFRWRDDDPNNVLYDYERAGLFTTYLAERIGPVAAGKITQNRANGVAGYSAVFSQYAPSVSMADLLLDFHTANLLNDRSVAPAGRYGYVNAEFSRARMTTPDVRIDGRAVNQTPESRMVVKGGGVGVVVWEHVEGLHLDTWITGNAASSVSSARLRVVAVKTGGATEVRDLPATATPGRIDLAGAYERVTLLLVHGMPVSTSGSALDGPTDLTTFRYAATWGTAQPGQTQIVRYDNGRFLQEKLVALGAGDRQANRFYVPTGTTPLRVNVAPVFASQADGLTGGTRDFDLKIWRDDGAGRPGAEILSVPVSNVQTPVAFDCNDADTTCALAFVSVDLAPYAAALSDLPETIYVGMANRGADANYLYLALSDYDGDNNAFLYLNDGASWYEMSSMQIVDDQGQVLSSLAHTTLPVWVEFGPAASGTPTEGPMELPDDLALDQNYPNPFNPSTVIRYTLPEASDVRLEVFDLTGRRIAVLVDGPQVAGAHTARLDATGWASGVYVYRLTAGARQTARQMVLVR